LKPAKFSIATITNSYSNAAAVRSKSRKFSPFATTVLSSAAVASAIASRSSFCPSYETDTLVHASQIFGLSLVAAHSEPLRLSFATAAIAHTNPANAALANVVSATAVLTATVALFIAVLAAVLAAAAHTSNLRTYATSTFTNRCRIATAN